MTEMKPPHSSDHNETDNKIAKRKILPQARPVLPEVEKREEQIIRAHNNSPFPKLDEDDPDILAAKAELRMAEEKLAKVKQDKIILKAVAQGDHLDPDRIEELCSAEPWKKGSLTELSKNHFGFVPEKFEMLAKLHPDGSENHMKYMEARDKARLIYWDQLRNDVRIAAAPLNRISNPQDRRAAFEAVNTKLWHTSNALKKDPLYQNQAARVFWAAEAGMRHHFEKNSAPSSAKGGDGYSRFKITAKEMDGEEPSPG